MFCRFRFIDNSMSIVETSEEGKDVVTKSNPRIGQKLDSWKDCEDLNVSELLGCTQVIILLFYIII